MFLAFTVPEILLLVRLLLCLLLLLLSLLLLFLLLSSSSSSSSPPLTLRDKEFLHNFADINGETDEFLSKFHRGCIFCIKKVPLNFGSKADRDRDSGWWPHWPWRRCALWECLVLLILLANVRELKFMFAIGHRPSVRLSVCLSSVDTPVLTAAEM